MKKSKGIIFIGVVTIVGGIMGFIRGLGEFDYLYILFGPLGVVLGYQLIQLKNWARKILIIIESIILIGTPAIYLYEIISILRSSETKSWDPVFQGLILEIISYIITLIVLLYLIKPEVKKQFIKHLTTQSS